MVSVSQHESARHYTAAQATRGVKTANGLRQPVSEARRPSLAQRANVTWMTPLSAISDETV
jgi:hypothetical protein